jgi:arsenate reductase (thioredoxin)
MWGCLAAAALYRTDATTRRLGSYLRLTEGAHTWPMEKRRVLFVCTHNSARSQMAEAMLREWGKGKFEAFSAGTEATGIRPETIQVMNEIGFDLSGQRSKTIDEFSGESFDWFITVCDEAQQNCPVLPGVKTVDHWSIEDPSAAEGSSDERLEVFRRVRDQIRNRLRLFILAAGREDIDLPEQMKLA